MDGLPGDAGVDGEVASKGRTLGTPKKVLLRSACSVSECHAAAALPGRYRHLGTFAYGERGMHGWPLRTAVI